MKQSLQWCEPNLATPIVIQWVSIEDLIEDKLEQIYLLWYCIAPQETTSAPYLIEVGNQQVSLTKGDSTTKPNIDIMPNLYEDF